MHVRVVGVVVLLIALGALLAACGSSPTAPSTASRRFTPGVAYRYPFCYVNLDADVMNGKLTATRTE